MTGKKRKRRKKIRKKDIKLFLVMCAIALVIGALLALFYGNGDEVRNQVTGSPIQEYRHHTWKSADTAPRRQIESAVDSATGKSER